MLASSPFVSDFFLDLASYALAYALACALDFKYSLCCASVKACFIFSPSSKDSLFSLSDNF